ncbi:Helicase-like transcription factor [Labeo rohita]|uniref:Helicase-like transcription factor n=1 Tax=Labeo rohita TaxID=84645 RepID=A0A498NHH6_LABRO|nr:Helicase-like transcription factor [Labeo rohita]RXN37739.1 Helicase-like transcription factor [Labeo rohita]
MDFIKWSLNAVDTIFSTRGQGSGEPNCPAETFAAGYVMDSWAKWRVMCMAPLSLEDIEDIYLFVTLITGFLLMGLGGALLYRRLVKAVSAAQNPAVMDRKLENIMKKLAAMQQALDLETSARY